MFIKLYYYYYIITSHKFSLIIIRDQATGTENLSNSNNNNNNMNNINNSHDGNRPQYRVSIIFYI